jgi:hypothetical protein
MRVGAHVSDRDEPTRRLGTVRLVPFCLLGLTACTLLTLEADRYARVEVDPVVRQHVYINATGELVENAAVQDHREIACATTIPRTCLVMEYIRATIFNGAPRPLLYEPACPIPLQRFGANGWERIVEDIGCRAGTLTPPLEIAPGTTVIVSIYFVGLDWRTAVDELRVELDLSDRNGDLPVELRVSQPFRLTQDARLQAAP